MGVKGRKNLIAIVGPTASGKSSLAVEIALHIGNAEIISADSRQIYKNMNIGTGKITKKEMKGIPHHLLDITDINNRFTVADYKREAEKIIKDIHKRDKTPILCGGTGFYVKAVLGGVNLPKVPPNFELREKLEKKNKQDLFLYLKRIDPQRAEQIQGKNKRKLIRSIEIVESTGKPVPLIKKKPLPYQTLVLCTTIPKNIEERVNTMIENGLEKEARFIFRKNKLLARETIGYAEWEDYFDGKTTTEQVKNNIIIHTKQYAKRQMVWFKKQIPVKFVNGDAIKYVNQFIKKGSK